MINFNIGIGKMQYGEKLLVRMVRKLLFTVDLDKR